MATTVGADVLAPIIAGPYELNHLGLTASLPTLPDMVKRVTGYRVPHGVKSAFYCLVHFTATSVMATGIKVDIVLAMDPNSKNADLGGTKAYFDAIASPITSGTSTPDDTALASSTAVATQTAALPTAVGVLFVHTITLPTTGSNSLAVDTWGLIRVRRLGDSASDTNLGTLVICGISAYGY